MDATDYKILKILQQKARIPNVEVARQIGMAPSAVLERIKKLEAGKIISGYEVRLNPDRFNRTMIAFIHIQVNDISKTDETADRICQFEAVQEVHHISGHDCLIAKVRVAGPEELKNIICNHMGSIRNIAITKSEIVLSTYKESARIPLTEGD